MSAIKIHLEDGECDAVARLAHKLGVTSEDIAYTALNRLMMTARDPAVGRDIVETRDWRGENLPLWSDSSCSIHAYEGKADHEPMPSRFVD